MQNDSPYQRIAVVGAFDRHNYGDLLFPLIVEQMARHNGFQGEIEYYSTSAAAMERYGAKNTRAMHELFGKKSSSFDLIVIAGGEVLPATWPLIVGYLLKPFASRLLTRSSKIVGDRISSYVFSKLMRVNSRLPFVLNKKDFDRNVKVVYNAVGGSHIGDKSRFVKNHLLKKLSTADFVSVRDKETQDYLQSHGLKKIALSPDSAILLSTIYPLQKLSKSVSHETINQIERLDRNYICFQSALAYVKGNEEVIYRELSKIHGESGLQIVLFSIGRATGHSDNKAIELITTSMGEERRGIIVSNCESIHDTMWVIANARAYIGTSLHGAITATSYGVPTIGLCPNLVPKLPAFLKTWVHDDDYRLSEYENLSSSFKSFKAGSTETNQTALLKSVDQATENFNKLFSA